MTISITTFCIKCDFAECRNLFIVMLNVFMLSVAILNVIMLSVVILSVVAVKRRVTPNLALKR